MVVTGTRLKMTETIKEMKARHDKEIKDFQDSCQHLETEWIPFHWTLTQVGGGTEVCKRCEKIILQYENPPCSPTCPTVIGD